MGALVAHPLPLASLRIVEGAIGARQSGIGTASCYPHRQAPQLAHSALLVPLLLQGKAPRLGGGGGAWRPGPAAVASDSPV